MRTLSVVSDFVCPWCYIGKARLDAALDRLEPAQRPTVRYLPFKLNPDMPPEGMERSAYRTQKFGSLERSEQLDLQVRLAAEESGISIRHDLMTRTPSTIKAHMLMAMASTLAPDTALRLAGGLFEAYFTEGVDIGVDDVLVDLAGKAGLPEEVAAAALGDGELRTVTESLAEGLADQGVRGVPTLLIDQHFLVSGAIPTDDLARMIPEAIGILDTADEAATGTA
ncbi:MAG: DsbA family oxidoreductase [Devosiaceae bacterium]|nr:DsbA family oxidoreductase [Devosiaceae bacterium MH13]